MASIEQQLRQIPVGTRIKIYTASREYIGTIPEHRQQPGAGVYKLLTDTTALDIDASKIEAFQVVENRGS